MEQWRRIKHFWANVLEGAPDECWLWYGHVTKHGYGSWNPTPAIRRLAHRAAYELATGPIPEGQHVHHTCRTRRCCNPAHLEVKDPVEHHAIHHLPRTHCPQGHPLEDFYGERRCPTCRREQLADATRRRMQDPEYAARRREYQAEWAARKRAEDPDFAERERTAAREYQRRKRAEQRPS